MAQESNENGSLDRRLAKSVGHPIRIEAMRILNERTASPSELAKALGEGVSQVSYHIQELNKYGCVELVKTESRRGTVEHFYRVARPGGRERWYLDDEESRRLSRRDRAELSAFTLQPVIGEALAALRSGNFDSRSDNHLSWTAMDLDPEGWDEVTALLAETVRRAQEIGARSEERLSASGAEGISAMVAMMGFERSERPVPDPAGPS
jgi:DNA-binding transcriptional ArsR family regulator